jgi:hypothetical protein
MLPPQDVLEQRAAAPFQKRGIPKAPLIIAGIACLIAIWFALGRPGMSSGTSATQVEGDTSLVERASAPTDTMVTAAAAPVAGNESLAAVRIDNPQDSARAARYGVVLMATNDEAQALARWASLGLSLPAGTVTMVRIRGERGRFFQVQAGAYATMQQADSLLAALRGSRRLNAGAGSVKSTPFALMLESGISRRAAQNVADAYGEKQIAAYPLLQPNNTATIYVGAFETPEQAAPLLNELSLKGVKVALHYRTGRSF